MRCTNRFSPELRVLTVLIGGLALAASLSAQNITASIDAANAPSGTATSPHFVIDSDASNAGPAYNRDTIPASVDVEFNWVGGPGSGTESFRATVELVDADGDVVALASPANSSNQSISLSNGSPTTTHTFALTPDPDVDLGAGGQYRLRYKIQRFQQVTTTFGTFFTWVDAAGPVDSSLFTVIHFTDEPEDPQALYVRGYLRGAPTWQKLHALQSGTSDFARSFRVSAPYTHARYDVGGVTESVNIRFIVEMEDDLGNPVPLENGGIDDVNFARQAFIAGTPNTPQLINSTRFINFRPTVQLDARNRSYKVRVRFEHLEIPAISSYLDSGTSPDGSLAQLLHFNGNLRFGPDPGGLMTVFSAISNTPTPGSPGPDYVETTANVTSGSIPGFPDYSFGDGSPLGVRLMTDGDAVVIAGSQSVNVAAGGNVEADFSGVAVGYPSVTLTSGGPVASSAVVSLPQGLSYTPNRAGSTGRYESEITVGGPLNLTSQFRHQGDLSLSLSANAWVFDESRPLLYQVTNFTLTQDGGLDFAASNAEWAQQQAFAQLEAQQSAGMHANPAMASRATNDGYLRFANTAPGATVRFEAAPDASVRCASADLVVDPGEFTTHFPAGSDVAWSVAGEMQIRDGLVEPGSKLSGVNLLEVTYKPSCADDPCGPGGIEDSLTIQPASGELFLTPDGGLHASGPITPAAKRLEWGIRADSSLTHRTDVFDSAAFLAGGNQIYEALNPLAAAGPQQAISADLAPGVITLAGFDSAAPDLPVYADTPAYLAGDGVWPGATVVVETPGHEGASRLADMTGEFDYTLQQGVSKYYVRKSGVSGRHVAVDGTYDPNLVLYGYLFEITRYQLTFLSNNNEDSWTNGSVAVPAPSDFTQAFRELTLTCVGALGDAQIDPDDPGPKPLAYWNGSFTPLSMRFAPTAGTGCYADRFLTIGLISGAANISSPLAGTLAFKPDGNIGTLDDNIVGADGRLGLPATVPLAGPGTEAYPLHPVTKLYFNNAMDPDAPPSGFVSFAATCGVPYFEDLQVHVMTSAQAGVPSPVYLASNWQSSGESHFTNTLFDGGHRGFPGGIALEEYQNPTTATPYLVRAKQSIFGIVPLDYPLRWSPTARFFESWETIENDLLVLEVEHQIDYLSADNAEISFGAQYDGMPKISLASAATEIVDGQLGAARALTEAAQSFVTDTLNQGVDEVGNLITDNMENLLDRAIDEIETEVICPLYDAVVDAYDALDGASQTYDDLLNQSSGTLKLVFDEYLDGTLGVPAESIKGRIQQLSDANAEASSLVRRVQDAVESGILAIDSIVGTIDTYRSDDDPDVVIVSLTIPDDFTFDGEVPGLLFKDPEREIVQALVRELINELASPDVAAVLNPLLADLSSDINAKLNELLVKFDPTLERVSEVLLEARKYLVLVRDKLDAGGDILDSFDQILTDAESEIDDMMDLIRSTAYNFIDQVMAHAALPTDEILDEVGNFLDEFSKEEFVALIRAELRDLLIPADFIRSIQYQLRQTISEFDVALRSAIDSAFAEVNRMCRELIKEALGPIDDKINELIGDVNDVVGAGSIDGYAHIQGDTLRRLRLDAMVELKVPDDLTLQAYFEMLCYDSTTDTGSAGCLAPGEQMVEVRIGALDVPLDWISPDLRANLDVWFSMQTEPTVRPKGIGGGFEMTGGELNFQNFKITEFAAGVAMGSNEAYLAAAARVIISDYDASGGIFFGRTCSLAPLEMVDPDVAAVLGSPPFTGAYVYGEVWLPISETLLGIPATCFFRISAGVGAGAFYFVEGPTFGGKMLLGASGEALCAVSIKGDVTLVGVMKAGALSFSGKGRLEGKAGACPVCLKFNKTATVKYENGSWSVDL